MEKDTTKMKQCIAIIKGRPLKYRIRRHSRAKMLKVRVSSDQGVVVTLPYRVPASEINESFVLWEDWLEEKVTLEQVWDGPLIREYASGSSIQYLGEPHILKISALPDERTRNRIIMENGMLNMELNPADILNPRPAVVKFLRKQAKEDFEARVGHWSRVMQLVPARIVVGDRTTRWGSCSSRGTLSFCYRLVLAPPHVIDAIVIHELSHLEHMNHGKKFWALVKHYVPNYEETSDWLVKNSAGLQV